MYSTIQAIGGITVAVFAAALLAAPSAYADDGWVAVANSPRHEQQDFGYGPDQASAELNALAQCAQLERADDCRVLAVSTDCVASAWDGAQPLNQLHAVAGGGPEVVRRGAIAAAGPYANDVEVRCTWWPREQSAPQPGVPSLTAFTRMVQFSSPRSSNR